MTATRIKKTDRDYANDHKYRVVSGGEFVPGVTTIIGIIDKPHFKWTAAGIAATTAIENARRKKTIVKNHREWLLSSRGKTESAMKKRALGQEGTDNEVFAHFCRGQFDRDWRAKAVRGNRIHQAADDWSRGMPVDVLFEDMPFIKALEQFHRDWKPQFKLVECIVINRHFGYGGRFDAIAWLDGPDCEPGLYLIDYKTGGHYPYEVALQAEGYLRSNLAVWDDDGNLLSEEFLPEVMGCRTVYLGEDGNVSVKDPFEIISHEDAWSAFTASLELYRISNKINSLLGKESNE
jgi:hypothetical protein